MAISKAADWIFPHLEKLQSHFSNGNFDEIGKLFKDRSEVHGHPDKDHGQGPKDAADFFKRLKKKISKIDFKLQPGSNPLIHEVELSLRIEGKKPYDKLAIFSGYGECSLEAKKLDPGYYGVWGHIDVCEWEPISEGFDF
jgi:hypothetical protein